MLLIDDCSTDNSYKIVKKIKDLRVISLPFNHGIGGAVQYGYLYAIQNSFKHVVQIDGDMQHQPSEIIKLINCYNSSFAELIIGSRYIGKKKKIFKFRQFGSSLITFFFKFYFNLIIHDPTSGMRLVSKDLINQYSLKYDTDFPEPFSIIDAKINNYKIKEIYVKMNERKFGISSINNKKAFFYFLKIFFLLFFKKFFKNFN